MSAKTSIYSLHPGYAREAVARKKIQENTGRSFEDWVEFTKTSGPVTAKERREWLKSQHGFSTNYAMWVAEACERPGGAEGYDPERLVANQYKGKESLRPLYDRLLQLGFSLGPDVKVSPCATMVPLYRKHVFGQIKPTTKTRIDLGLALGDTPAEGRLISTGGYEKKDRITHRVAISSEQDIDDEVVALLRRAYERDA